ncbi:PiggyBac transposable element-derived protein 3 [Trichinella papuae]|uniref:PiggyBac transposable element-derived protein 3 n=1 Tax=Trichinella papuae TaxID=268474 RepID=A0A0V1LZT2_9BILA|nr:PiggyBac transposable element-derived protein 3 [Trichinella papuae]
MRNRGYGYRSKCQNTQLPPYTTLSNNEKCPGYFEHACNGEIAVEKRVYVVEPNIIRQYNQYMGGVDVMDKMLFSYQPKLRSRKWWWNLFSHAMNMAVVAAWKLHTELHTATNDQLSHLEFRREITIHLLHAGPFVRSHPGPQSHLPISLRTSHGQYLQSSAQRRCVVCQKNCRNECVQSKKGYTEIVFRPNTV